jgi:hypothetical protein
MKLVALAPVVVTLATALITGCGPGLTTRANGANAPTDAKLAMDSSLSQELIGTTSLTSAPLPLPATLDPWSPPDSAAPSAAAVAPVQTWGADPELDPKYNPEYGF